jgi:hypothetical protein
MEDDDQESRIEFMLSRYGRERQRFVRVMLTVLSKGSTSKLKILVSTRGRKCKIIGRGLKVS